MQLPILSNAIDEEDKVVFAPDGRPIFSPSQHDKIDCDNGCDAAWGFRYIDGLKLVKPSAALGTAVHEVHETYQKTRQLPQSDDIGLTALSGIKYCPHPDPGNLLIEHYFADEVLPGYWERGKIDIYDPMRKGVFETEHLIGTYADSSDPGPWLPYDTYTKLPIPLVIDHKTTSDFKWMKTDQVLRGTDLVKGDPQPSIYGTRACKDFKATYGILPPWVHFRWIYYLTKKGDRRAKCIDLRMRPDEIWRNLLRWLPDVDRAAGYYAAGIKTGNDLPKKGGAVCKRYGGCEYGPPTRGSPDNFNICHMHDGKRFSSAMSNNVPLAQQVNAMLGAQPHAQQQGGGMFGQQAPAQQMQQQPQGMFSNAGQQPQQQQAAQAGGMFNQQAPAQQQQPAAQGGMFNNAASQQQSQPAQQQGGMFQQQAPAQQQMMQPQAGGMFSQQAPAQQQQQAPATTAQSFMQQPITLTPDARLLECPANVPVERRQEWLSHCDANGLNHRTGLPNAGAGPASIPMQTQQVPAQQQMQAQAPDPKQLALAIYNAGQVPMPGQPDEVVKAFSGLVAMLGAKSPEQQQASNTGTAAKPQRRKRRTAAEMQAAAQTQGAVAGSPLAHPDVIAFIREFRDFLDQFLPEEG